MKSRLRFFSCAAFFSCAPAVPAVTSAPATTSAAARLPTTRARRLLANIEISSGEVVTVHSPGTGSFSRIDQCDFGDQEGRHLPNCRENVPVPLLWAVNGYGEVACRRN